VDADPGIIDQKIEIVPLPVVPERILTFSAKTLKDL